MEKVDEIFKDGVLFITTKALPGETAQSILAGFDRPDDLAIVQLPEFFYLIYLKSKREKVGQLITGALINLWTKKLLILEIIVRVFRP